MPPKAPIPLKATTSKTKTVVKASGKIMSPPKEKTLSSKNGTVAKKSTPDTKEKKKNELKQAKNTREDLAAIKIQKKIRQFLAKKQLEKKKKEKQDYEEKMEQLEKEAYHYLVKMEKEQAERKHQKEEEEKRRKQEEAKRKKRMLEAAFDGDVGVMKQILKEVSDIDDKNGLGNDVIGRSLRTKHIMALVECEDPNGNSALSEAANGGHAGAIRFLLEQGADPNSVGQFKRTPLYRASFGGHLEAVLILLENGADPRICAADNENPIEIASTPAVKEVLESWDMSRTEAVLKKIQAAKDKRSQEDKARREAETNKLENVVAAAEKEFETKQKQLEYAYCELNKRIHEHDTCMAQGFAKPELTVQAIHDQELEVESAKIEVTTARDNLAKARLALRESTAAQGEDVEDTLPGLKITIKEMEDVLFRDVGNRLNDSGKWPLLIDVSGQASTFLRYRDTNCIFALRPSDMDDNNVRRCLLGAIRYGKPLVLDMMEVDMFDTCVDRFDNIMKGLMKSILDKSILKEEKYSKLIKTSDGPEYEKTKFNQIRIGNFMFILVTKNPFPSEKLLESMYVIRVVVAG